jgi:hypothetical protein
MGKYFDLASKHKHREMKFHGEPVLVRLFSHAKWTELMDKIAMSADTEARAGIFAGLFVDPVELKPAFTAAELLDDDFPKSDFELLAELLVSANITPDPEKKS